MTRTAPPARTRERSPSNDFDAINIRIRVMRYNGELSLVCPTCLDRGWVLFDRLMKGICICPGCGNPQSLPATIEVVIQP